MPASPCIQQVDPDQKAWQKYVRVCVWWGGGGFFWLLLENCHNYIHKIIGTVLFSNHLCVPSRMCSTMMSILSNAGMLKKPATFKPAIDDCVLQNLLQLDVFVLRNLLQLDVFVLQNISKIYDCVLQKMLQIDVCVLRNRLQIEVFVLHICCNLMC